MGGSIGFKAFFFFQKKKQKALFCFAEGDSRLFTVCRSCLKRTTSTGPAGLQIVALSLFVEASQS
jgi:hypothetical protein